MSYRLMQRKFSEPNTYIDGLPSRDCQEELYDDVEMSEPTAMVSTWTGGTGEDGVGGEGYGQTVPKTSSSQSPTGPPFVHRVLCMGLTSLETYLENNTWLFALIGAGCGE